MKKRDIVLILILLVISLCVIIPSLFQKDTGEAYIYVNGELYASYDLSAVRDIHIEAGNGIVNDISIADNSIYMKDATCPDRICVHQGPISRNNESICCAPAGLLILIRSKDDTGYDAILE